MCVLYFSYASVFQSLFRKKKNFPSSSVLWVIYCALEKEIPLFDIIWDYLVLFVPGKADWLCQLPNVYSAVVPLVRWNQICIETDLFQQSLHCFCCTSLGLVQFWLCSPQVDFSLLYTGCQVIRSVLFFVIFQPKKCQQQWT